MNSFLKKQLDKKIDKFFEGKTDNFVVAVTRWLSFGDGPSSAPPEGVSQEEFDYLVKEIVGEQALANLIYELREKPQFFSKLEGSEKSHLAFLNTTFLSECYFRLQKRVREEKMSLIAKDLKKKQDALKNTARGLNRQLRGMVKAEMPEEAKKSLASLIEMVDEAIKTEDYSKLLQ